MIAAPTKYRTISYLCQALGWPRSSLHYKLWISRTVPPPTHHRGVGRRTYYTDEEIDQIKKLVDAGEL